MAAARKWWDSDAEAYWQAHGEFLGTADFIWCPEGLNEATAGLLGPVAGADVLEIGCGTAPCSRWLAGQGARVTGLDLSLGMLSIARELGTSTTQVALVQADAGRLPFADDAFDIACSAYGALPFIGDLAGVFNEVARVLRPGGAWVFSLTHPIRWCFLDDGSERGLVAQNSYWDERAYVELDEDGEVGYAEHHHTMGAIVRSLSEAGFVIVDLIEPTWPSHHDQSWGGWSPLRGRILPGTAIFSCVRPGVGGE